MTLETLITFLTIENNNMHNYIVTFEYRVMVTAFAILAMFSPKRTWKILKNVQNPKQKKQYIVPYYLWLAI